MNFYMVNHILHTNWNYPWDVVENMIPFEREFVISLIINKVEEDKKSNTPDWINNPQERWNAEDAQKN